VTAMSETQTEVQPVVTLSLSPQGSFFCMGEGTHRVPMLLHKVNRDRLFDKFQGTVWLYTLITKSHIFTFLKLNIKQEGIVLVQGGKQKVRYNTDHEPLFRQESFFQWLFGVMEADCYGILDLSAKKSILLVPRLPESYAVWMGPLKTLENFREYYEVDQVRYVDEIPQIINEAKSVFLLQGTNTDSGLQTKHAKYEGFDFKEEKYNFTDLFRIASELRVIKTDYERDVLRYVARVTSEGHVACMQKIKPGMKEYQVCCAFRIVLNRGSILLGPCL
jgi:hypothetical protein